MSWFTELFRARREGAGEDALPGDVTPDAAPLSTKTETLLSEAAGGIIDNDEYLYRPIMQSPDSFNDIVDAERLKQRRVARNNYFRSAMGGAMPDMLAARLVGPEVTYKCPDDRVQAAVDKFVKDPDNDLEQYLLRYVTELLVFGELVFPIFLTPANADVRMGYLMPDQIEEIIWRRTDAKKPIAVVQRAFKIGDLRRLWVIPHPDPQFENHFPPHPALTPEAEAGSVPGEDGLPVALPVDDKGEVLWEIQRVLDVGNIKVAGYAFYHRTHCLVNGRGRSIYERVNDWIKANDDWLFGVLRNAILQGNYLWHVVIQGATRLDIKEKKKELSTPPRAGSVIVSNEKETWAPLAPNTSSAAAIRELHSAIVKLQGVAVGIPGHELGAEEHTNRATAQETGKVGINRAKRLQKEIASMVKTWIGYQVDQKVYRGQLPEDVDRTVQPVLPELDSRDQTAEAQGLQFVAAAVIPLVESGLVLQADARTYAYKMMGLDLPPPEEFQAKREQERQQSDGAFMAGSQARLAAIMKQLGTKDEADTELPDSDASQP